MLKPQPLSLLYLMLITIGKSKLPYSLVAGILPCDIVLAIAYHMHVQKHQQQPHCYTQHHEQCSQLKFIHASAQAGQP